MVYVNIRKQMKKEVLMKYIFVLCIFACFFHVTKISTYAKEQSIAIEPKVYKLEEKNDFTITSSSSTDNLMSDIGTLEITGDITIGTSKNGTSCYVVNGNEAKISYNLNKEQFNHDNPGEWYFVEVKDKKVDGMILENKILKGSIVVQTSLTGENWITNEEYTDVFGTNSEQLNELYRTKDVQLQNGCYYRIIIAYEQEKVVEQKKIGPVKTEKKERRRIAEEYVFFAESRDKGQVSSPDISPKKIYGKKGDVSTAVNTGKDNGYCLSKGTSILESDDPQYGWALGYFTINGYTSDVKDEEGNYIFLKNVGDQVTLWFTLEKDINDLNGDGRLSISEDKDAEDLDFQIQKTNFKRGTLIIRHLDSENQSRETIIYNDYLAANASTGANTKVILFEEGDYEVALDYEIKKEPRKIGSVAIIPEYTNYKIYFKFSIRNGNCMAYPFDVNSGSELRDGDICEDGFTVQLAGSKYNDITIKYEVVVGEDGQKKFDTRKNMIAKEGASYTDEGIYTFCVNNPYTNVTTTKTVFVGTDPYLKALAKTGRSLSDINDKIQEGYIIEEDGSIVLPKIEKSEQEMEPETEADNVEVPVTTETESTAGSDVTESESDKTNGSKEEVLAELEKKEETNRSIIVPISVGLVIILGMVLTLFKNKNKKMLDLPQDPEED